MKSIDPVPGSLTAGQDIHDARDGAPVALESIRSLLKGLDGPQRRAVTHGEGPLLVLAGPGTGKTRVITRRIAWLINTKCARPSQILALTFTDRAAEEMQARVDALVPYGQADTSIHTFHAFGDRVLREHGLAMGLPEMDRVISRAEAMVLLREHLFELGLQRFAPLADPSRFLGSLVDLFARAKEEGIGPREYAAFAEELAAGAQAVLRTSGDEAERSLGEALLDEAAGHSEVAGAYARYQDLLRQRRLMDFGDQVMLCVELLERRAAVRAALRSRYRYVLVDEFQDSDRLQARLVELLAGHDGNVTFVGDDDQAIYAFRGAAVESMLSLTTSYPGIRRVVLRRNHRSRPPILAAARRLIVHNDPQRIEAREGLDKMPRPARRTRRARPVRVLCFGDTTQEADHIAGEIAARVGKGRSPGDFGVLVRVNADARPVLESLTARGVPWRFSGSAGLLRHPEVRAMLSLARVICDPASSVDLYAALTARPYRLGGEDMTALLDQAGRRGEPLWSTCRAVVEGAISLPLTADGARILGRFVADVRESIAITHERSAGEVLYAHLRRSGWLARLVGQAERGDDAPLRRVARLFDMLKSLALVVADARMAVMLPYLQALIDAGEDPADEGPEAADAVSVLTVHQAKGLEFPVVYLVGLSEGRFPMRSRPARLALPPLLVGRTPESEAEDLLAEERRLMFVAMTRARDELTLSHAERSTPSGRRRRPSPFIAEALDQPVPGMSERSGEAGTLGRHAPLERAPTSEPSAPPVVVPGPERGLDLSFSQLDDYLTCPLRYHLRHELRVPTPPHHALVVGNAMHQALATHYRTLQQGGRPSEIDVLATLQASWQSEGFLSREHEEARFAAARTALVRFCERERGWAGRQILAVEKPFAVRLGADTIRGRYDLVVRDDQGVGIVDHKSSQVADARRAREKARDSLQLQIYSLAFQAETGSLPDRVALHFVDSGLMGSITPDPARLERARDLVARAAEGIRSRQRDATPGYPACSWCPFLAICPATT